MTDFQSATANEIPAAAPASSPKVRSAAADAWRDLRRSPIFWIASVLVVIVLLMAVAPRIFTPNNPGDCVLSRQYAPGTGWALFGFDFQGCDIYARAVYGARASLLVGGASALLTGLIAMLVGMAAGFFGGWADAILSRVTDIVLGIPLLLAAIVLMKRISNNDQWFRLFAVVFVLAVLGWTTAARVIRSSVISAKQQDYVAAARMLGASDARIMWRHILPNSLAPFIVVLTIALGAFISAEATLSFLGIGLQAPTVSWGIDIDTGRTHMRDAAMPLVVPSAFLALTVLAFIMLGDAIRDAFDPKLR